MKSRRAVKANTMKTSQKIYAVNPQPQNIIGPYERLLNVPCIPPIFHNNKLVTDFSKKADLFNSFVAKQCSVIENSSALSSSAVLITNQYLESIEFTKDDIKEIICKIDPNKAHGHDMISICMLKMSSRTIIKSHFKILKNFLNCGTFPGDWKKGNIAPIF